MSFTATNNAECDVISSTKAPMSESLSKDLLETKKENLFVEFSVWNLFAGTANQEFFRCLSTQFKQIVACGCGRGKSSKWKTLRSTKLEGNAGSFELHKIIILSGFSLDGDVSSFEVFRTNGRMLHPQLVWSVSLKWLLREEAKPFIIRRRRSLSPIIIFN